MSVPKSFKEQKLLSIAEVADAMGVHRATVWKWIKDSCLRATVPTVADPSDPQKRVPVSKRFKGVRPEDLAKWRSVYRPVAPAKKKAKKKPSKKAASKRKRKGR